MFVQFIITTSPSLNESRLDTKELNISKLVLPSLASKLKSHFNLFDKFKKGFQKSASAFSSGLKEIIVKKELKIY